MFLPQPKAPSLSPTEVQALKEDMARPARTMANYAQEKPGGAYKARANQAKALKEAAAAAAAALKKQRAHQERPKLLMGEFPPTAYTEPTQAVSASGVLTQPKAYTSKPHPLTICERSRAREMSLEGDTELTAFLCTKSWMNTRDPGLSRQLMREGTSWCKIHRPSWNNEFTFAMVTASHMIAMLPTPQEQQMRQHFKDPANMNIMQKNNEMVKGDLGATSWYGKLFGKRANFGFTRDGK